MVDRSAYMEHIERIEAEMEHVKADFAKIEKPTVGDMEVRDDKIESSLRFRDSLHEYMKNQLQ